ncbi:MAG: 2-dehydro-3-deoxyphosphogluconate aldolase, partial [Pseudomonadota bacterium]
FRDYLALDCVTCVGGSWMVKAEMIENDQWDEIESLARAAMDA